MEEDKKQREKFYEKHYLWIKDNLNIIILCPTVVGGIWQLMELSSISTSFIRFFSISQLVSDGILILFLVAIFYACIKIVDKQEVNENMSLMEAILYLTFTIIAFMYCCVPLIQQLYTEKVLNISEIVILIPLIIIIGGGVLKAIIAVVKNVKAKLREKQKEWIKKNICNKIVPSNDFIIYWLFILLCFIILNSMRPIVNFRKAILFPDNLMNKEVLEKKIMKENALKSKPRMLYNNDKYFFYEILDKNENKKILIIDYERLTEKDTPR